MFYETVMHKRRPVSGPDEAARLIHDHQAVVGDALCWTCPSGFELMVVADNLKGLNAWFEVAVIDYTNKKQIESITMGWIDELERKAQSLRECETTDFNMGGCEIAVDGANDDMEASFECGCCGTDFTSTPAKQKKFDQDTSYGICSKCERYYA